MTPLDDAYGCMEPRLTKLTRWLPSALSRRLPSHSAGNHASADLLAAGLVQTGMPALPVAVRVSVNSVRMTMSRVPVSDQVHPSPVSGIEKSLSSTTMAASGPHLSLSLAPHVTCPFLITYFIKP